MPSRLSIPDPGGLGIAPGDRIAIAVMAKVPQAGKVKTRLVPPLTAEEASGLHAALLRDVGAGLAEVCTDTRVQGFIIYSPADCEKALKGVVPRGIPLFPQRGERLEERMLHAAEDLFSRGYTGVCLLNADSPTLPRAFLRQAANALISPGERIVLGPAEDGGYYLIGMKQVHARLFEEIDWSTAKVFAQTLERAAEIGLAVLRLAARYDVDDASALRRLCEELFSTGTNLSGSGRMSSVAPHSREFLRIFLENGGAARLGWGPFNP